MTATVRTVVRRIVASLAALLVAGAPQAALACPVCFGALEGPVAEATNQAVLALLGVTVSVLGGFATFFIYLIKRARAVPLPAEFGQVTPGRRDAGDADTNLDSMLEGAA